MRSPPMANRIERGPPHWCNPFTKRHMEVCGEDVLSPESLTALEAAAVLVHKEIALLECNNWKVPRRGVLRDSSGRTMELQQLCFDITI